MATKPSILLTRKFPEAVEQRIQENYAPRFNTEDKQYTPEELLEKAKGADALFISGGDRLNAGLISQLPNSVRAIATLSVGYDHIDLKAAKQRNIVVINTPGVLTDATADLTMLLMLGAARRAHEGETLIRAGKWVNPRPTELLGKEVYGQRLGIYGMGRIGQAVAKRSRAFDMTIHYHNRHRLPPEQEGDATFHENPEDLLRVSDYLSFHSPATPETKDFLNAQRIALLPDGAVVINAARGSIIVDDDLIAALKSGKVTAAGLDVYNNMPHVNPGYIALPNTFLMPHLGSATDDTRTQEGFLVIDNFDAFFASEPPPDLVTQL